MSTNIGENISYFRKQKGLTQDQLGQLLNISGQAFSKWENGGVPDIGLLPKIAKIFDTGIDALFGCKKSISEKIGISQQEFSEIAPLLVKYVFLSEDVLLLDDKEVKIYNKSSNPEIRPLLMMAYQYINSRQHYCNFMSHRTKPYFDLT